MQVVCRDCEQTPGRFMCLLYVTPCTKCAPAIPAVSATVHRRLPSLHLQGSHGMTIVWNVLWVPRYNSTWANPALIPPRPVPVISTTMHPFTQSKSPGE